jgi:hypothetical protein
MKRTRRTQQDPSSTTVNPKSATNTARKDHKKNLLNKRNRSKFNQHLIDSKKEGKPQDKKGVSNHRQIIQHKEKDKLRGMQEMQGKLVYQI